MADCALPALREYDDMSGRAPTEGCARDGCARVAAHHCACGYAAYCSPECQRAGRAAHAPLCWGGAEEDGDGGEALLATVARAWRAGAPMERAQLRALGRQGLYDLACSRGLVQFAATRGIAELLLGAQMGASFPPISVLSTAVAGAYPEFARLAHDVLCASSGTLLLNNGDAPGDGFKLTCVKLAAHAEPLTLGIVRAGKRAPILTLCRTSDD